MGDDKKPLADRVEDLEIALVGRPQLGVPGILKRVSDLEDIVKRWQRMEWMLAGALVLMSVSTAANLLAVGKALGILP